MKRESPTLAALCIAFSLLSTAAVAEPLQRELGGKALTLPLPDGHCLLDPGREQDRRMISLLDGAKRPQMRWLAMLAACDELGPWRSNAGLLTSYGTVHTWTRGSGGVDLSRRALLDGLMAEYPKMDLDPLVGRESARLEARLKQELPKAELRETRLLGPLHRDDNAVYLGMFQRVLAEDGLTVREIASVVSISLLNDEFFYVSLYQATTVPEDDRSRSEASRAVSLAIALEVLVERSRAYMTRVIAANEAA